VGFNDKEGMMKYLDVIIFGDEDIEGFDISVDDVVIMEIIDGVAEFPSEIPDLFF